MSRPTRVALIAPVERVAAIDIGSNSIRQLIADVAPTGDIHMVDEMKAAPRLSAGMGEAGLLTPEAMERATEAIVRMATLARQRGANRIEVVATSAVREAQNASEFVERVVRATQLRPRILTGTEEARLGFRSALAHFDLGVGRTVVADLGGGSLELALSAAGVVDRLVSLPCGALRLTEQFLSPAVTRRGVRELRHEVRQALRQHLPARAWQRAQFIGSGGTFTNLARMALARQGVAIARTVHGTRVTRMELEHILDALQEMSFEERLTVPGLSPARADIIVAGLAVIAELVARLEVSEVVVSAYGIREGLILETARVAPVVANPGEARERSLLRLLQACRADERHARHVRELALQLFDALGARLGADTKERDILAAAALLHDIGYHISYEKHHKHSFYLISHAELLGTSPTEQLIIANVARYHRGADPKRKHRNLAVLDKATRAQIQRLAALLRVADGLDRGHISAVGKVRIRWTRSGIFISPIPRTARQSIRLETWGATRKAALLSRIAGVPVMIAGAEQGNGRQRIRTREGQRRSSEVTSGASS